MRVVLPRVRPWWHELANCLHASVATVLAYHQIDPLPTLGAAWEFWYRPGDVRREEYYHPCPVGRSLVGSIAPHHRIGSRWHRPVDAAAGWRQVRAQVASGRPAIVAVDNFELPFRPAYQDVHSNHLIVVYGFDDAAETAMVLDPVPPGYHGELALARLTAARDSGNRSHHERDMFFADNPIGNRWLSVDVPDRLTSEQSAATIGRSLRANLAGWVGAGRHQAGAPGAGWRRGLAGLAGAFEELSQRHQAGDDRADELFVIAGAALAGTGLHASHLTAAGRRLGAPRLSEAGRYVERVAHHWTAVRILAARGRGRPAAVTGWRRRGDRLLADLRRALAALAAAEPELATLANSARPAPSVKGAPV